MPLKVVEKWREMRNPPVLPSQERLLSRAPATLPVRLSRVPFPGSRREDALARGGAGAVTPQPEVPGAACPRCAQTLQRGLRGEAGVPRSGERPARPGWL